MCCCYCCELLSVVECCCVLLSVVESCVGSIVLLIDLFLQKCTTFVCFSYFGGREGWFEESQGTLLLFCCELLSVVECC